MFLNDLKNRLTPMAVPTLVKVSNPMTATPTGETESSQTTPAGCAEHQQKESIKCWTRSHQFTINIDVWRL